MKLRIYTSILVLAIFVTIAKISVSRDNFAPAENSGAPSEASCGAGSTGCHNTLSVQTQFSTDLVLTANGMVVEDNFEYTPGTTYNMEFTINDATARNGFSFSALNSSNSNAGSFSIPANSDAEITANSNMLNRTYVGHTNTLGRNSWTFEWTSPGIGEGDVNLYANANKSNNNGVRSNDTIIPFQRTIVEAMDSTTSIRSFVALENDVTILSNPISGNVLSIEMNSVSPKKYSFEIFDVNGRVIQMPEQVVLHGGYQTITLPFEATNPGVYVLRISGKGNEYATFKLMRL